MGATRDCAVSGAVQSIANYLKNGPNSISHRTEIYPLQNGARFASHLGGEWPLVQHVWKFHLKAKKTTLAFLTHKCGVRLSLSPAETGEHGSENLDA